MQPFDREQLIRGLPEFLEARNGVLCENVRNYLVTYNLLDLVERGDYRIGRICLDEVWVTVQLFAQLPAVTSRGTIVVVHGYMDHAGLYMHLIKALHAQGFDLLCYDLSGHGLSDGDPLAVDDFQHYATQLTELLSELRPRLNYPVHLLGQSTGAAVIMAQQLLFAGGPVFPLGQRILLAPLVRPALWRSIRRKFRLLKYVLRRVPRRYSRNSHDEAFCQFVSLQDPLQHREIPVSWIGAMLAWGDWLEQHKPVSGVVHMIQGTEDGTVDWRHNKAVLEQLYPELEVFPIEEGRHHLVNEAQFYRDQVFNRVESILQRWENENGQP